MYVDMRVRVDLGCLFYMNLYRYLGLYMVLVLVIELLAYPIFIHRKSCAQFLILESYYVCLRSIGK